MITPRPYQQEAIDKAVAYLRSRSNRNGLLVLPTGSGKSVVIAGIIREQGRVDVQAIGAGAVNQAMKAAAIARGYLLLDGINIVIIPSFSDVTIEGSERTAVRLSIEPR